MAGSQERSEAYNVGVLRHLLARRLTLSTNRLAASGDSRSMQPCGGVE